MIIAIRDLKLPCVIGFYPHERLASQVLSAQIELTLSSIPARYTDNLNDTVDYEALERRLVEIALNSQYALIERLAQVLLDTCFAFDSRIIVAKVELEKPGCLKNARSAVIRLAGEKLNQFP